MPKAFTYSTYKAGIMPGVTKGFQEFVSSLDGKLTAMTASPKQAVKVCLVTKRKVMSLWYKQRVLSHNGKTQANFSTQQRELATIWGTTGSPKLQIHAC